MKYDKIKKPKLTYAEGKSNLMLKSVLKNVPVPILLIVLFLLSQMLIGFYVTLIFVIDLIIK